MGEDLSSCIQGKESITRGKTSVLVFRARSQFTKGRTSVLVVRAKSQLVVVHSTKYSRNVDNVITPINFQSVHSTMWMWKLHST